MEIRVLKYFLSIAKEGSITKAANNLHLTQPTLSRQIQELEKELNQKLFIRKSHNISLTPEGLILKKRAEEIIDMVEKTEAELSAISETIKGNIYIGGGETCLMGYIAETMYDLNKDYPDVKFHMYSGNAEDVTEKLDKGLLDFGVLIQPISLTKYDHLTLPEKDIWGVIMRKDSPLALKDKVELKDLLNIPLIASRQMSKKYSAESGFLKWFGDEFDNLNIVSTYNLVYNAAIMVKKRIGYAIALDKLANTSSESEICFRPLSPKLESGLDIVWKKDQAFSAPAKLFLEKLKIKLNR